MPTRKTGASGPPPDRPPDRPSDDDLALWRHVTRDARPLAERPAAPKRDTSAPSEKAPPPPPAAKPKAAAKATAAAPAAVAPPKIPDLAKGVVAGVDKRTAGRLKRGKLPVEGRLDLHGLSQSEAERALAAFLALSQDRGHRCVLVITGKGGERRAEDFAQTGVLRRMVPVWLNAPRNRARVLAFDEARAQHGGAGALYVLLKRARSD
jgi:DNA-nicking Smr family endonuclease